MDLLCSSLARGFEEMKAARASRYWFFWESETRDRIKEKIRAFINGAPVQART